MTCTVLIRRKTHRKQTNKHGVNVRRSNAVIKGVVTQFSEFASRINIHNG